MRKPVISLIAAISENRVIGEGNKLPWHIPQDLKRFQQITSGHPAIMGRKTYESVGRLLPNRTNIIITRNQTYHVDSALIVHSLKNAISEAKKYDQEEIFIIGGGQIFSQAIKVADKLYLTIVHTTIQGDAYFPNYSNFTKVLLKEDKNDGTYSYTFLDLSKE